MRTRYRMAAVGVLAGLGVLPAGPASAHVEVSADRTTAGATDVTLTFRGAAENDAAGIAAERVVLPAGIAPADVTLVDAPPGWRFTRTADGFTVGGRELRVGADARWSVRVAKLPDGETRLSFRTVETYGDGKVSRWIEIRQPGQDEPANPAPLVTLRPGPSSAAPAAATASVATPPGSATPGVITSPSPSATTAPTVPAAQARSGSSRWWIWVVAALVLAGAAALLARRRRGGS